MKNIFEEFSFIGLIIIPIIFFISRKILREKKSFLIILTISVAFSLIGVYIVLIEKRIYPNFDLYWFCPLYSLLLYRLMLIPFWLRKKRDPKIPPREFFYSGEVSLFADKLFCFVFFLLSVLLPMILIINT